MACVACSACQLAVGLDVLGGGVSASIFVESLCVCLISCSDPSFFRLMQGLKDLPAYMEFAEIKGVSFKEKFPDAPADAVDLLSRWVLTPPWGEACPSAFLLTPGAFGLLAHPPVSFYIFHSPCRLSPFRSRDYSSLAEPPVTPGGPPMIDPLQLTWLWRLLLRYVVQTCLLQPFRTAICSGGGFLRVFGVPETTVFCFWSP